MFKIFLFSYDGCIERITGVISLVKGLESEILRFIFPIFNNLDIFPSSNSNCDLEVNRGKNDCKVFGNESTEISTHAQRISSKLYCFYSREYQIPDTPTKNSFLTSGIKGADPIKLPFEEFKEIADQEGKLLSSLF